MEEKRVYVGNRYVPLIMGVWNQLESYESLSIVTWEGTSYTSKKRVPAGVTIENEEYWVVTGNYNAQIESYRQQLLETTKILSIVSKNVDYFVHITRWKTENNSWDNALNDAFNYLRTKNLDNRGGVILFPSGTYVLSPFTMPMRVSIKGEGIGITVLKAKEESAGHFITFNKFSLFSRISDFTADGNKILRPQSIDVVHYEKYDYNEYSHNSNIGSDKNIEVVDTYTYNGISNVLASNGIRDGFHIEQTYWGTTFKNLFTYNCDGHGVLNLALDTFFDTVQAERSGVNGIYDMGNNNKWTNLKTIWNGVKVQKNSAGLKSTGKRNIYSNVEAQDNFCDGIRLENANNIQIPSFLVDGNSRPTELSPNEDTSGIHIIGCTNIIATGIASNYSGMQQRAYTIEDGETLSKDVDLNIFETEQKQPSKPLNIVTDSFYSDNFLYNGSKEPVISENGLEISVDDNMSYFFDKNVLKEEGVFELIVNMSTAGMNAKIISDEVVSPYNQFFIQRNTDKNIEFNMSYLKKDGSIGSVSNVVYLPSFPLNKDVKIITMWRKRLSTNERGSIYLNVEIDGVTYENSLWVENIQSFITPKKYLGINKSSTATDKWSGSLKFIQNSFEVPQNITDNYKVTKLPLKSTNLHSDFQNYRPKNDLTKIIDYTGLTGFGYTPTPSQFYRGKTLLVTTTNGDSLVTCLRQTDGTYIWN